MEMKILPISNNKEARILPGKISPQVILVAGMNLYEKATSKGITASDISELILNKLFAKWGNASAIIDSRVERMVLVARDMSSRTPIPRTMRNEIKRISMYLNMLDPLWDVTFHIEFKPLCSSVNTPVATNMAAITLNRGKPDPPILPLADSSKENT
jgi:hypothetical protein